MKKPYLTTSKKILTTGFFMMFFVFCVPVHGQDVKQLEAQIQAQKDKLQSIDREIAKQQAEITKVVGEGNTLKQAVSELENSEKKLTTEIKKTKAVIGTLDLEIQKSTLQISETQKTVNRKKDVIAATLRDQYYRANESILEQILKNGDFSTTWENIDTLDFFNRQIRTTIELLEEEQKELESYQETQSQKQEEFEKETAVLAGEQVSVTSAKQAKDSLLQQTKNKESEYRKLLSEKVRQREAFEGELFAYEAALVETLSASQIPSSNVTGLLRWPIDNVVITQLFGKTGDSGRLYASGTHNGIDMGTPIGTKLYATQSGVIKGLGNTDSYPGCYSYGKWMLVQQDNGLSTLYAHMSAHSAVVGQRVSVGDVVGLSGNTGYSTGPHLHFTLFASEGVAVQQYSQSNGCKQASIPLSTKKGALLDPILYLPKR